MIFNTSVDISWMIGAFFLFLIKWMKLFFITKSPGYFPELKKLNDKIILLYNHPLDVSF